MASNTFLKKDILVSSWQLYKKHAGILTLLFGISLVIGLVSYINDAHGWSVPSILFNLLTLCITVTTTVILLDILHGRYTNIKTALKTSVQNITIQQLIIYIITSILYTAIVGFGTLLVIIPGIIFALMFMFYGYIILDENSGVFKSLKRSKEITKGHRWNIFMMGLIMVPLIIISALPFGLGLFITMPLAGLVMGSMYMFLKKTPSITPTIETPSVK